MRAAYGIRWAREIRLEESFRDYDPVITHHGPLPRGPGSSFISQVAVTTGRTARIRGQVAEIGAWVEFCSDDDDGFLSGGVALNCAHPYSRVCRDTPLSPTRKAMTTVHRILGFRLRPMRVGFLSLGLRQGHQM